MYRDQCLSDKRERNNDRYSNDAKNKALRSHPAP